MPPTAQQPALGYSVIRRCRRLTLSLLLCLPLSLVAEESETDWVARENLTPAQRQQLPAGCCGAYISPLELESETIPVEQLPLEAEADRSSVAADGTLTFSGNVSVRQGPRRFQADNISANRYSRELTLTGEVELRERGLLIRADEAWMNLDHRDAALRDSLFVLHESRIRGRAAGIEKFGDQLLQLNQGEFTTCEPDRQFWSLYAQQVKLYPQKDYGSARHARLYIKNIPVLYIPYIRFPLGDARQSGLLFPSFTSSNRNGEEISQPFYWNIAPNMDATITPRYLSRRGLVTEVEVRHLSPFFETEFNGGYLSNDRGGYDRRAEAQLDVGESLDEAYPNRGQDRWMIQLNQRGGLSSRIKTLIDYTDISDPEYQLDINSSDTDVNRQAVVRKHGSVRYAGKDWLFNASAEEYRQLNIARQKPYKELPRLSAYGRYRWDRWQLDLLNEYTRFDFTQYYQRPTENLVTGQRLRTDYGISWDQRWTWGYLKPRLNLKTLSYHLQATTMVAQEFTENPSLAVPQASVDMGLFFERNTRLAGNDYLQTLEPRLFYFYSDHRDHGALYQPLNSQTRPLNFDTTYLTFSYNQLFRTTRFAGGDRIDDANQIALGITSRFIDETSGVEVLRLSLGQIYRFASPQVGLTDGALPEEQVAERSEYAAQISGMLNPRLRLAGDALYSEEEKTFTYASTSLEYGDDSDRIASLTYRYKRQMRNVTQNGVVEELDQSLHQLDIGMFLPVSDRWSLIGRSQYDFTHDRELDTFAGFEYNDCCYRVRFLWRRWLDFDYSDSNLLESVSSTDYDRGYFIDLQLKGLASISERVGDLLGKTILGYKQREDALR